MRTFTVHEDTFTKLAQDWKEEVKKEADLRRRSERAQRLSGGASCLYSPRLLKQTCTSQEGKIDLADGPA